MSKYDLSEVQKLVNQFLLGSRDCVWFSARSRSLDPVIKILHCSNTEAEMLIMKGILKLKKEDFCRSKKQWDLVVDEYGLENYKGHHWYVKFSIVREDAGKILEEISFHPLEKNMRLVDGRILRVTDLR